MNNWLRNPLNNACIYVYKGEYSWHLLASNLWSIVRTYIEIFFTSKESHLFYLGQLPSHYVRIRQTFEQDKVQFFCIVNLLISKQLILPHTLRKVMAWQSNDSFVPQKLCDICDEFPFINSQEIWVFGMSIW